GSKGPDRSLCGRNVCSSTALNTFDNGYRLQFGYHGSQFGSDDGVDDLIHVFVGLRTFVQNILQGLLVDDDLVVGSDLQGSGKLVDRNLFLGGAAGTDPTGTMADGVEVFHAFLTADQDIRRGSHASRNQHRMARLPVSRRIEEMIRRKGAGRSFSMDQHQLITMRLFQGVIVHQVVEDRHFKIRTKDIFHGLKDAV